MTSMVRTQPSALAERAEPGHPQSLQPTELPRLQHIPMHCILHHQHTVPSNATFRCRSYNGRWPKCSAIATGQTSYRVRAADLEPQAIRKARKKRKKEKKRKHQKRKKNIKTDENLSPTQALDGPRCDVTEISKGNSVLLSGSAYAC